MINATLLASSAGVWHALAASRACAALRGRRFGLLARKRCGMEILFLIAAHWQLRFARFSHLMLHAMPRPTREDIRRETIFAILP